MFTSPRITTTAVARPAVRKLSSLRYSGMDNDKTRIAAVGEGSDKDSSRNEMAFHAPESMRCLVKWNNPRNNAHALITPMGDDDKQELSCSELEVEPSALGLGARLEGILVGEAWTVAICALWGCRDVGGISASLRLMGNVVLDMGRSELDQSSIDFDVAIKEKRTAYPHIFVPSVERMVLSVSAKLKAEVTACLPLHVLEVVFGFMPLAENGLLCTVSKDFREAAEGEGLWRRSYAERFHQRDRAGLAESPASAGGSSRVTATTEDRGHLPEQHGQRCAGFKRRYMRRMLDPHVGDRVEVSWKGKFRLESFEVYNGMAWWLAEIVRKSSKPGHYQVHYPGWETRWDEWVTRDRLRWGNERRAAVLKGISPSEGDSVEMWCEGVHVPGAWLEADVHAVEDGRLYLGEVLTTGHFWVDVEDVRLVKQGELSLNRGGGRQGVKRAGGRSRRRGAAASLKALGLRACLGGTTGSCSLM